MATQLIDLRERMSARYTELTALYEKEERSPEDESRVDSLIAELNDLSPKLDREEAIAAAAGKGKTFTEPAPSSMRAAAMQAAGGTLADPGAGQPLDRRSLMAQFLESEQVKEFRANPRGAGRPFPVGSFWPQDAPDVRTLIWSAGTAASLTPPQIVPGIYGPRPTVGDNSMRTVLNTGTTSNESITFFRENSFTNAAAPVAEAVSLATGLKPDSALDLQETTVPIVTIAHGIPITRQVLDDAGQLRSYVEGRLIDGLVRTESNQIINGNGTPPNMTGLLAASGIQVLDGAYFTANPVAGAATGVENYNRILRGKTKVATTGLGLATFIAINPADWEPLIAAVNASGVFYGNGPFGLTSPERLWGLPVVLSVDLPSKVALVGDGTYATIWDREAANVAFSESHSDYFMRNIIQLRAEERVGLTIMRGAAFAKVTLA